MIPLGNVLIIDDQRAAFEMYRDILEPEGYRVRWATDRASGLREALAGPFDVVILDQRLRGESGGDGGIDLVAEIVPTGAKVIIVTGYADAAMIERAFRDGAYDYLQKVPTLPALLRIKVQYAADAVRERRIAALAADQREVEIREAWEALSTEADRHRKGKLLEDMMVLIFKTVPGFRHVHTRARSADEEIDLIVRNESTNPFWAGEQSQYIIVECKNWSSRVTPDELVVFRDKIANRSGRCRLGFLVSLGGFTKGFHSRGGTNRKDPILVVPVDHDDLARIVHEPDRSAVLMDLHGKAVMAGDNGR